MSKKAKALDKQRKKPSDSQDPKVEVVDPKSSRSAVMVRQEFQGPLPPPELLRRYEEVLPGLAERIVSQAESEQGFRHEMMRRAATAHILETTIGQIFGLLIGVFTVGAGAYAAMHGAEIAGSLIGTGGVAGLVAVFIIGRKTSENDDDD